ncbi:MAG TPA: hypothetical protein VNP36_17375 [Burkholderiales bacterium]|nr:hypothetical protein [Burkholderiales bacterium]
MEDADFSDEFCRFLRAAVPTVDAAEVLLLLSRERERWWAVPEAAAALAPGVSLSEVDAARYLAVFQAGGLIAIGPDKRAQYRPGDAALEAHVHTLEQAYRERPVTLIRVIYALRDSSIQSFADAFRLRKS